MLSPGYNDDTELPFVNNIVLLIKFIDCEDVYVLIEIEKLNTNSWPFASINLYWTGITAPEGAEFDIVILKYALGDDVEMDVEGW